MNQVQHGKAEAFAALHAGPEIFVIPNPWDIGSAQILTAMGFKALATTSAGYAFSRGRLDGTVSRDQMLAHVAEIVAATPLPVSADLEDGYGDAPEDVGETILPLQDFSWRREPPGGQGGAHDSVGRRLTRVQADGFGAEGTAQGG